MSAQYGWRIDSFSGAASELKGKTRTHENVLAALRRDPKLSCFDLSEYAWLRSIVRDLERSGKIKDKGGAYPWVYYDVLPEKGKAGG